MQNESNRVNNDNAKDVDCDEKRNNNEEGRAEGMSAHHLSLHEQQHVGVTTSSVMSGGGIPGGVVVGTVGSSSVGGGIVANNVGSGGGMIGNTVASAVNNNATTITTASGGIDVFLPFWDYESHDLDKWIHTISALFPSSSLSGACAAGSAATAADPSKYLIAKQLWSNLKIVLNSVSSKTVSSKETPGTGAAGAGAGGTGTKGAEAGPKAAQGGSNPNNKNKGGKKGKGKKKKKKRHHITGRVQDDIADDEKLLFNDPYHIWFDTSQSVPTGMGAKLAELNVGSIVNALIMKPGGVVDKYSKPKKIAPTTGDETPVNFASTVVQIPSPPQTTTGIPPPPIQVKLGMVMKYAIALQQSIKSRVEADVLIMTPLRIQQMLSPDLQNNEFKNIRKRVYDTVVLGKGMASTNGNNMDDEDDDSPVVAGSNQLVHDIEKFKRCKVCGNNDQSSFILDRKNGDVICSHCGVIVSESIMHEGSQYRKFEGEADRNHHGDAANPLYSNAHNMGTTLGGVQITSGAGMGGFGSKQQGGGQGGKKGFETVLRNAHAYTELNISNFGSSKEAGRTRVGYKDKQKKQAFVQMTHVGDALNLHEAVVQRAKELFAGFRDDRELVHQLKGVIAACLCEAFDQLSSDGKQILQQQEKGIIADGAGSNSAVATPNRDENDKTASPAAVSSAVVDAASSGMDSSSFSNKNTRAARRALLHKVSMAGKGGLLLDYSNVKTEDNQNNGSGKKNGNHNNGNNNDTANSDSDAPGTSAANNGSPNNNASNASNASAEDDVMSQLEMKPAPSWDIEDCRAWLLEAARIIAQNWVNERDRLDKAARKAAAAAAAATTGGISNDASVSNNSSNIPVGTMDELQGLLFEHSMTICEHVEQEVKNSSSSSSSSLPSSSSSLPTKRGRLGGGMAGMGGGRRRVMTPRVNDMSKLGIKWQHGHERGSGGKGGVGNSGKKSALSIQQKQRQQSQLLNNKKRKRAILMDSNNKDGTSSSSSSRGGRTPGQVLILISAKKLGQEILKGDTIAGDAIHRELRHLISRQEARKKLKLREEETRKRLLQMKRKPWLQARMLQDD